MKSLFIVALAIVALSSSAWAEDLKTQDIAKVIVDKAGKSGSVQLPVNKITFDGETASLWLAKGPLFVNFHDFQSDDDLLWFKERILKNPDLELHVDHAYMNDTVLAASYADIGPRIKDVWVVNPKTGAKARLSDLEENKLTLKLTVLKPAPAAAPAPATQPAASH